MGTELAHVFLRKRKYSCQWQNSCCRFYFFVVCRKKSLSGALRDNGTYGDKAHLATHKPTYVTLPIAFCVTRWIIHDRPNRGNPSLRIGLLQSSAFYERLYFYSTHINKSCCADSQQSLGLNKPRVRPLLCSASAYINLRKAQAALNILLNVIHLGTEQDGHSGGSGWLVTLYSVWRLYGILFPNKILEYVL